ncbi:GTP cyclohydrolase II [Helicobacter macacae]|uniref:GTP cyclohydrolase-2 n=1 Tax=Helicobacter macacae MIT 99-5501 TaxID=1357400 RepID=V8C8E7_9HELI|nr:GTP cyclohydrolase II [Helicobacter macacae]ETD23352.1 GTP cyclohydrolase II [Helicobacter macacae MIT 99-5501]
MDLEISTQAKLPTRFGDFVIQSFLQKSPQKESVPQAHFANQPKEHLVVLSENLAKILAQNLQSFEQNHKQDFGKQNFKKVDSSQKDFGNIDSTNVCQKTFSDFTPLLRVHSECLTGDVFGSQKCDCGGELALAMQKIAQSDREGRGGLLIYLRQEGRGIGLFNKVNAYALQDKGYDTVEANIALGFSSDDRDYSIVGGILEYYGIGEVELLTNNPKKIEAISRFVRVKRSEIIIEANKHNQKYLATKKAKLGHLL